MSLSTNVSITNNYKRTRLDIVDVIPTYMEDDPESENWGVVIAWKTPTYLVKTLQS